MNLLPALNVEMLAQCQWQFIENSACAVVRAGVGMGAGVGDGVTVGYPDWWEWGGPV